MEAATCPQCGNLKVVCSNPDGVYGEGFYPQLDRCYVRAAAQMNQRRFDKLHEHDRPDANGYLAVDGARLWISPENLTPDDDFLLDSLSVPGPEQAPGE